MISSVSRLAELMSEISESHIFTSWPLGWEDVIWRWLDQEEIEPVPFDNRRGLVTAELWAELKSLRKNLGGWLVYDEASDEVCYVPESKWLAIVAERNNRRVKTAQQDYPRRYVDYHDWIERKRSEHKM